MEVINFVDDGTIDIPPAFFENWIIDNTLSLAMDRIVEPSSRPLKWRFRTAAASLASEVFAARLNWDRISSDLVRASQGAGMAQGEVRPLLADASTWGRSHPPRWMALTRSWVFNLEHGLFVNVMSGASVSQDCFDYAFAEHCPLPGWTMSDFLSEEGLIVEVDHVVHDVSVPKSFLDVGDVIIVNCPIGVLTQ